jgi:hypothetical protein
MGQREAGKWSFAGMLQAGDDLAVDAVALAAKQGDVLPLRVRTVTS